MDKLIDTFGNRLLYALQLRNMKPIELAEKSGVNKGKISSYLNGRYKANQNTLYLLATTLQVNPVWLMGYDVPIEKKDPLIINSNKQFYMCPVYGRISAGEPNWAEEFIEGKIPLDTDLMGILNPEEHFFLRVNGESMNKIIKNGSFALIHKQDMVNDGEIAVVLVNGYDATLKKFTRQGEFVILEPMSDDSSFTMQVYNKDTQIQILGKYIGKMEINN